MTFPVLLQGKNKTVDTSALIDSGVTRNFMDLQLLSRDNFVLIQLPTLILAYNVDGTTNQKGTIRWKVRTTLTLGVTVRGHGLILSIVHLPPLTIDSPFTFTILIVFFADTFRYIVW